MNSGDGQILRAVLAMPMPSSAKVMWLYLWDRQGGNGEAWPKVTTICRDCALSKDTVLESGKKLEALGLVQIARPDHPSKKRGASNSYTVVLSGRKILPDDTANRSENPTGCEPRTGRKIRRERVGKSDLNNVLIERTQEEASANDKVSLQNFIDYWHTKTNLGKVRALTNKRRDHFNARTREPLFAENWKEIVDMVSASAFCTGDNGRGWRADIDWILKNDTNYAKVLEGKYDRKPDAGGGGDYWPQLDVPSRTRTP